MNAFVGIVRQGLEPGESARMKRDDLSSVKRGFLLLSPSPPLRRAGAQNELPIRRRFLPGHIL